ncbi:hypothetical protein Cfor_06698 [Coptotermes formosanus]|uniref:Uncharacterized protein n=1 Tax=Coptotermes formosanus TaxID=36987 RepID=A0A6L2Q6V5_COPFO|nr:hypothetical protein Cfor_06698 [Coptotermes formosanus]
MYISQLYTSDSQFNVAMEHIKIRQTFSECKIKVLAHETKISDHTFDASYDTNMSVVIGIEPKAEPTKGSFVVYAESVTEDAANKSSEGNLPISEARMSSGNMNLKSALGYSAQDMEYYRAPVYTAKESNKPTYDSAHPPSSTLGQDSSKINSEQPGSHPPHLTPNYSRNGQGNAHKPPETFQPKEATQDKRSDRNDLDKQRHFLKLPQDPYSGPDSYHTTTPAPNKSPPLPPVGIHQSEPRKENYKAPLFKYQPQKPEESVIQPMEQYQIPSSTEFHKPIMLNYQPPDRNEPYVYQLQPPKGMYEPQMDAYQYAKLKEFMKPFEHTQNPQKPRNSLTPPSGTYQPPESSDSITPPAAILQPPKQKDSFKPTMDMYHAKRPEDSLTPPVDTYEHPKSQDPFTQHTDTFNAPKPRDTLTPPVDLFEHPKPKDSFKPHMDIYQPLKQEYDFKGATEFDGPFPAKEIHKPFVLSPEEFYKPHMEAQKPSEDNKIPSPSKPLRDLPQSSPLTNANNNDMPNSSHTQNMDDDVYLDYDPSAYVQKENSNGHAHNNSHEYDHPAEHLHSPEPDHSHKYSSHDYSHFYLQPPAPPKRANGAPPPPPKELNGVMPQPPKDMKEDMPSALKESLGSVPPPAKEINGALSPQPTETHEAPSPPSKELYGSPHPLSYLPKDAYADIPPPPKYIYGEHNFEHPYGVPPPPPMTAPPPPPPKRRRYGYYYIGRKLYLIPAYFSFLFIPYVLALIIRSVIRHKVQAPFKYWGTARKNDLDADETERRVARALEAAEKRYE